MNKFFYLTLALVGVSSLGEAAQIREGATACRNHKALVEIRAAERVGDQATVDWLFNGAACIKLSEATEVNVIAGAEDGIRRLRTLNKRRNIDLWVGADELEAG